MRLIERSISKPKALIMIFTSIILLGIISIKSLSIEYLPEIEIPKIVINTIYPSATPEDVREKITIPLENSLSSISGLKEIKSVSRSSISTIELFLEWGSDIIDADLRVRETIDSVYTQLPKDAIKPQVIPVDPNNETIMVIGISSESLPLSKLKKIIEDEVRIDIQKTEGVGSVNIIGGKVQELHFLLKEKELSNIGLTPQSLADQFSANHVRSSAGSFNSGNKKFLVIGDSNYKNLEELKNIQFTTQNQNKIPSSDLATAILKEKDQSSAFFFNNGEGIGIEIKKRFGSSQNEVSRDLNLLIKDLEHQYKTSFTITKLYDKSQETEKAVFSIVQSLILGSLIAFLLLYWSTKRLLTSTLLMITIPISLLITFFVMNLLNMSINIMSLGGIAIVLGMLVDNSVIVLENINRKYNIPIYTAVAEVAKANFSSTITTLIVFLPLLLLPGVIGVLYKELAITVSVALLSSFIVSITLLPGLYNLLNNNKTKSGLKSLESINKLYNKSLKYFLHHKFLIPLTLILISLLTIILGYFMRLELVSPENNKRVVFNVQFSSDANMEFLKSNVIEISDQLSNMKYFDSYFFRIGAESGDIDFYGDPKSSSTTLYGTILIKDEFLRSKKEIIEYLNAYLFGSDGKYTITAPQDSISKLLGSSNYKYKWLITSDDTDILNQVQNYFKTDEVNIFPSGKRKTFEIKPKREALNKININPDTVFKYLRSHVNGVNAGTIIFDDISYNVKFINNRSPFLSVDELKLLRMPIGNDSNIQIKNYVDFIEEYQNKALYRENKQDAITISSNTNFQFDKISHLDIKISSVTESILRNKFMEIMAIFILAVIFIYLFLGAQFESFKIPLLLLITLPLSILGVAAMLIITNTSLNLNSSLGILVLFGIVVNNSIVLKEKSNQLIQTGKNINYSVVISAMERFTPIMITSLTTILSLLPIAFELFGPNAQSGMAWVIIGGMLSSTFLTLYIVPSLSLKKKKNEN